MLCGSGFDGFNASHGLGQKRGCASVGLVLRFHFFADQRPCNEPQYKVNHQGANHQPGERAGVMKHHGKEDGDKNQIKQQHQCRPRQKLTDLRHFTYPGNDLAGLTLLKIG